MNGSDKSLSFKINEDRGGEELYFKRRNGKLLKLGDGTFGVVYVVHSELRENDFAVKLLYDNESTTPRPLSHLTSEAVSAIVERVLEEAKWTAERVERFLEIVRANFRAPDALPLALSEAGLTGWQSILETVRKRANSTAVERFNRESRVSAIIRAYQLHLDGQAQVTGLVDIIGGTQRFRSYPAFEHLRHDFIEMGVEVSDYALVMEKYEFSLKDVLERGPGEAYWISPPVLEKVFAKEIPDPLTSISPRRAELERMVNEQRALADDERRELCEAIETPPTGYELLKRMTFEDRIRTALPFLRDIVVGLSRLHRISYEFGGPLFHLDIKPANIYVKRDAAKGLVCALGDLGFLPGATQNDRTSDTSIDDLPLGTLHFRSPEQKEHFDVANVEVHVHGDDVFLEIRDPKFSGSFIEKGDSVIFSRDKTRIRHEIIDILASTPTTPIQVRIDSLLDRSREGEQTQVIFLKRQEFRTDLFGIGAIAFDLISCGRSSERFYESVRRFEFDGGSRGSVESTVGKYRRVKDGLADEPELIHIFEPFHRGSDYASEAFVEVILKCMLYQADKTFYAPYEKLRPTASEINADPAREDPRGRAVTDVLAYIDAVLDYKNNAFYLENPLVTLALPKPPSRRVDRFETIINCLQEPAYDWKLRLAQGAYYYEKLVALVQDRTRTANPPFLYQMLPAGIRWLPDNEQSPFQFAYSTYATQRDYEQDLLAGDMDKMLRTVTNPFVPNQIAFARREVLLTLLHGRANAGAKGERCTLRFLDAASSRAARSRDWIVHRTPDDEMHLWQIADVLETFGRNHVVVSPVGDSSRMLFGPSQGTPVEAVYYSRLVPGKYYLDVLGLYLLNLLVANSPLTTNDREKIDVEGLGGWSPPAEARSPQAAIKAALRWSARLKNGPFSFDRRNELMELFELIANTYLKLTCHGSSASYYGRVAGDRDGDLDPADFILDVVNDAKALRNKVERFLSVPHNTFENECPTPRKLTNVSAAAEEESRKLAEAPLDIKDLLMELRRQSAETT